MKIKKLLTAVAAMFVLGSSAFAFDGETFWREYGGGLKDGDGVFSVGAGVDTGFFAIPVLWTAGYNVFYIPYIETSYEKMVHINDMLPFSFGGYGGFNMYTYNPSAEHHWFYSTARVGALAKYHFNFCDNNMDVYAGIKIGLNTNLNFYDGTLSSTSTVLGFDYGGIIGVQWFWDNFGITLETGYPCWLNFKLSFKM